MGETEQLAREVIYCPEHVKNKARTFEDGSPAEFCGHCGTGYANTAIRVISSPENGRDETKNLEERVVESGNRKIESALGIILDETTKPLQAVARTLGKIGVKAAYPILGQFD